MAPTVAAGRACLSAGVLSALFAVLLWVGVLPESLGNVLILAAITIGVLAMLGLGGYGCVIGNRAAKGVADKQ